MRQTHFDYESKKGIDYPSAGFARNPRKSEPRIVTDEHG